MPPPVVDFFPGELVFKSGPARIAASPGAFDAIEGIAVLTNERLVIVPGAKGALPAKSDPHPHSARSLWEEIERTLLQMFSKADPMGRPRSVLAARGRPGIEIPLAMVRRAFEGRLPGWAGIELGLPRSDPRPPFALYLRIDAGEGTPREWVEFIEAQKHAASCHPELERPYALFYLFRPLPRPGVRVRSSEGVRRGALVLHPDGPAIAGVLSGERVLLPYESITRVVLGSVTPWRRAWLRIEAGEHVLTIDPRNDWDFRSLHDCGHLIAEVTGAPLRREAGQMRTARVLTAIATVAGTAAAVAWQVLHSLP
jgi:hypothetical protein